MPRIQASVFVENWRTSLDRSVLADAQGLLNMARAALAADDLESAGRLGRAALVTAVIAADACVTDTLKIAHEWAGDSQTDVPSDLQFGPSYETWQYLTGRIEEDRMSFLDKLHLGLEVIFAKFPCEQSTVDQIQQARQLRNHLVHLHSLKENRKGKAAHETLFEPNRVIDAAGHAISAVESLIEEMDEFFDKRCKLPRAVIR